VIHERDGQTDRRTLFLLFTNFSFIDNLMHRCPWPYCSMRTTNFVMMMMMIFLLRHLSEVPLKVKPMFSCRWWRPATAAVMCTSAQQKTEQFANSCGKEPWTRQYWVHCQHFPASGRSHGRLPDHSSAYSCRGTVGWLTEPMVGSLEAALVSRQHF